jgi:hypothetical protein
LISPCDVSVVRARPVEDATLLIGRGGCLSGECAQIVGSHDAMDDGHDMGMTVGRVVVVKRRDPIDGSAEPVLELAHGARGKLAHVQVLERVLRSRVGADGEAKVARSAPFRMPIEEFVCSRPIYLPLFIPQIPRHSAGPAC